MYSNGRTFQLSKTCVAHIWIETVSRTNRIKSWVSHKLGNNKSDQLRNRNGIRNIMISQNCVSVLQFSEQHDHIFEICQCTLHNKGRQIGIVIGIVCTKFCHQSIKSGFRIRRRADIVVDNRNTPFRQT